MVRAGPNEAADIPRKDPRNGEHKPLRDASEVSCRARGRRCPVEAGRIAPELDSPQPFHFGSKPTRNSPWVPRTCDHPQDSALSTITVDRCPGLECIGVGPVKGTDPLPRPQQPRIDRGADPSPGLPALFKGCTCSVVARSGWCPGWCHDGEQGSIDSEKCFSKGLTGLGLCHPGRLPNVTDSYKNI